MIIIGLLVVCLLVVLGLRWRTNKRREAEEEERMIALRKKALERIELGKSYKDKMTQMFISDENKSCLRICADDKIILFDQKGYKAEDILGCSLVDEEWTEIEQESLGVTLLKGAALLALTGNPAFAAGAANSGVKNYDIHHNYGLRIILKDQDKNEDIVFACGTDMNMPQEAYNAVLSLLSKVECPLKIDPSRHDSTPTFNAKQAEKYYKDYRAMIYDQEISMTQYRDWTPILKSLCLLSLDSEWIIEDIRQDGDKNSLLSLCAEAKKYGKSSENERYIPSNHFVIGTFAESALIDNLFSHIRLDYTHASIWQAWLLYRTNRFVGLREGCIDKELTFLFSSSAEEGDSPIVILNEDNTFVIRHEQVTENKARQQVTATGRYNPLTHTVVFIDIQTKVIQGGTRTNKKGISADRYHGRWYGMMLCLGEMSGRDISEEITNEASERMVKDELSNEFPEDYKYVEQLIKLETSKAVDDTMSDEERHNDFLLGISEAKKVYMGGMNWKRLLLDKGMS